MADLDLLVRIVELDGELVWHQRLRRRRNPSIGTNRFGGQRRLRPVGLQQDLAIKEIRDPGVVEGDGILVLCVRGARVQTAEGVGGAGFVAKL